MRYWRNFPNSSNGGFSPWAAERKRSAAGGARVALFGVGYFLVWGLFSVTAAGLHQRHLLGRRGDGGGLDVGRRRAQRRLGELRCDVRVDALHGVDAEEVRCVPVRRIGVVDVGGGSTELVVGTIAGGVRWAESFRVGSGYLADHYLRSDPPAATELEHLRRHGLDESLAAYPRAHLAGVAAALGVPALTLETPADLDRLAGALPPSGPVLLDAQVTRSIIADKFR